EEPSSNRPKANTSPQPVSPRSLSAPTPVVQQSAAQQPPGSDDDRLMVSTWYDFFLAADLPPEAAREYEHILQENAIDIDQLHELTLEILQSMGFRMGHLLKIMRTLSLTEVAPLPQISSSPSGNA